MLFVSDSASFFLPSPHCMDHSTFFLKNLTCPFCSSSHRHMLKSDQTSVRPPAIFKMLISYCSKRTVSMTVVNYHTIVWWQLSGVLLSVVETAEHYVCLSWKLQASEAFFLRAARMKNIWGGSRRWLVYAARTESFSLSMASSSGLQQEHVLLSISDFICSILLVSHNHQIQYLS